MTFEDFVKKLGKEGLTEELAEELMNLNKYDLVKIIREYDYALYASTGRCREPYEALMEDLAYSLG